MTQRLVLILFLVLCAACSPVPGEGSLPLERTAAEVLPEKPGPTPQAGTPLQASQESTPAHNATATPTRPVPEASPTPDNVHPAQGAGRWYPAGAGMLRAAVEAYIDGAAQPALEGRLLAVIVPHAGYVYSGPVAGYAYRALQQAGCRHATIAVIGDTHTAHGSAEIAVWSKGAFETPLGAIAVDEEAAAAIVAADKRIRFDREAFDAEHPVENQLPFLQVACPGARIVPVVIRQPSLQNAQILGDALVDALGASPDGSPGLIVASTDLSHYHPYEQARRMDEVALQAIVSLDPQAVADSPRRCVELGLGNDDPLTMCSQGAVMSALIAARQMGADRGTVLHYANSGDVPVGERDQVVGYGAVALWQAAGDGDPGAGQAGTFSLSLPVAKPAEPIDLSPEQQEILLALARDTAREFLTSETMPTFETDDPALLQPLGAYVTYETVDHERNETTLRGCLGRLEPDRPVYLNVQYAAVAAAVADPRFPTISPAELETLALEITLLEPMQPVADPKEIEIGQDGVMMRTPDQQGALFLPQVPTDQGWDLEDTLVELCRKAGLPDDAWQRPDTRFYVFEGQWFGGE